MYSQANITSLYNRIGWRNSEADKLNGIVSAVNKISESGRYFEDFSPIITIHNIYKCVEEPFLNDRLFNTKLNEINISVIHQVLSEVFNQNEKVCNISDPNECLTENLTRFDDAIGYGVAIKCIEIMLTSTRKNIDKKLIEHSYENLMVTLNGIYDDGKVVSEGLVHKYSRVVRNVSNCLVDDQDVPVTVNDKSYLW